MRGILSVLTTRLTTGLLSKPVYKNGTLNLIPQSFKNELNAATFTSFTPKVVPPIQTLTKYGSFLKPNPVSTEQIRTVIKFSLRKGKRKTVGAVLHRFFRLHWGIWIRTIAGRNRGVWKKSGPSRNRRLQHVFCNATQSRMLDKMVSRFWRKPKYYINDPYEPYHTREEFPITRKKPWRPDGVDYE